MEKPLSKTERTRFEELIDRAKKVLEKGTEAKLEMGLLMLEIRDERLYREEYDTFEELCEDLWAYSRQHAYRLIDFKVMRGELEDRGIKLLPQNERQVRPLKKLPTAEARAEAWGNALAMTPMGDKPPPQSAVQRAVEAKLYDLEPPHKEDEPLPQTAEARPVEAHPVKQDLSAVVDVPPQPEPQTAEKPAELDVPLTLDHIQCPVCHSIYKFLEEYMRAAEEVPQNARPNGKEQNFIRGQLEQHFSKISNIPMPLPKTEKQKSEARVRWWTPLRTIAELANWNQAEAEMLIEDAFKLLRSKGFLIEAPQSIQKTVTALAAGQTASSQQPGRKKSGYELYKEMYQND